MKSINYFLIFVTSSLLAVACGGGAGPGSAGTTSAISTISNNLIALSAAFAPVAF